MRGRTQVGLYTSMVVDMCVLRGMTQVGQYTSMVVDMCVLRGMTQVGQYTSMVVGMCVRYDTGRSVYKHGSRCVCCEV